MSLLIRGEKRLFFHFREGTSWLFFFPLCFLTSQWERFNPLMTNYFIHMSRKTATIDFFFSAGDGNKCLWGNMWLHMTKYTWWLDIFIMQKLIYSWSNSNGTEHMIELAVRTTFWDTAISLSYHIQLHGVTHFYKKKTTKGKRFWWYLVTND